ncbi:branched-chain amino acid ABC transporter substrate-binding protein [Variovorax ginsengisoli]|uniref:Branched-chain amino acid ABC transporter substrate-binding protein n=1 Tax=Variovorax ginsengisoli TaxID=363844 RepID=A0ABT8SHI6_9BURK|nr:branched-chain amino acid ABC transporter substrate-binding protein [Variovorax ginsengisoli]MDN8618302.1 branched-chain amino acid ABC transporter substrate-binding protein [Variovorax ginsengisoli]MDO1537472.1 branched-chain amino acid ABC transporter substrate-binding protein [Variovorax ginsengisoli]
MTEFARLAIAALALAGASACAATLTLGIVQRADDDRLEPARVALAYPGQPGGRARDGVDLAVQERQFELETAGLQVAVVVRAASSADDAAMQLRQFEATGTAAALLDLPAAWIAGASAATAVPLLNVGDSADASRQQNCRANLFHTLPSERMRADALAQALLARKWMHVLLISGPRPEDASRLVLAQAALKRYGLKQVANRNFTLSADPRERESANPLLLTGTAAVGGDYDVAWVVDSDGEFARTLPWRIALPRPVVGDAGMTALAWAPHFERYGAPQLARRFARMTQRPMTSHDWAAYIATKALLNAALEQPAAPTAARLKASLNQPGFTLDGFKGVRLSFRAWDHQLRQPMLLSDGVALIGTAPVDGVMHAKNVLDTLGTDAPESPCKGAP